MRKDGAFSELVFNQVVEVDEGIRRRGIDILFLSRRVRASNKVNIQYKGSKLQQYDGRIDTRPKCSTNDETPDQETVRPFPLSF